MDARRKKKRIPHSQMDFIFLESSNKEHLGSKSNNARCFNTGMKIFIGGPLIFVLRNAF